jgi:hypothetical protein
MTSFILARSGRSLVSSRARSGATGWRHRAAETRSAPPVPTRMRKPPTSLGFTQKRKRSIIDALRRRWSGANRRASKGRNRSSLLSGGAGSLAWR